MGQFQSLGDFFQSFGSSVPFDKNPGVCRGFLWLMTGKSIDFAAQRNRQVSCK